MVVLGGLEVSEKCSGSIPHVAGYKVWLINWSIRHVHTDNLHIAVYTGTINLHHLRHYYLTCIQVVTLEMFPIKHSTGSSPLLSRTVNSGPKSQNTDENTPRTEQDMNWLM